MKKAKRQTWIDLHKLRRARGWFQQEAADKLGVNRVYLSALENGKHGISRRMMARIIDVFGVAYEDFSNPPPGKAAAAKKTAAQMEDIQVASDVDTKEKILDVATKLFALKGFKAVTLKDIAKAVDIRIASIYYYYADKEALIHDVLSRFENAYAHFHNRLARMNETAGSLEEMMDNLFTVDELARRDPIACLGMSMVLREQHNHKAAAECALRLIYEGGIENLQASFSGLAGRGLIPPSDTKCLAMLYMFCIMAINEVYLHRFVGLPAPLDCTGIQKSLRAVITQALAQGIPQQGGGLE